MIGENIARVASQLPSGCRLVAVSKLKPADDIREAYAAGQRLFGENYATELRDKAAQLPADIEWHFIGHVQGKQLKYYMPFVSLIHGIDSLDHLVEADRAAERAGRTGVGVLLQVHVAREETKFGFAPDELLALDALPPLRHVCVRGLMAMASKTDDYQQVRSEFRSVRQLFDRLRAGLMGGDPRFCELSMGMSHDWAIAVDEGSTLVRLGTSIFGPRDYSRRP